MRTIRRTIRQMVNLQRFHRDRYWKVAGDGHLWKSSEEELAPICQNGRLSSGLEISYKFLVELCHTRIFLCTLSHLVLTHFFCITIFNCFLRSKLADFASKRLWHFLKMYFWYHSQKCKLENRRNKNVELSSEIKEVFDQYSKKKKIQGFCFHRAVSFKS